MVVLIIDIEATCCDDESIQPSEQEVIEIGAVVVDDDAVAAPFTCLVKPSLNRPLSALCIDVTGIQQQDVDGARTFPEAWKDFQEWLSPSSPSVFFSWGTIDKRVLSQDCRRHAEQYFLPQHIDLSRVFTRHTGRRRGRRGAIKYLGITTPARNNHRAIDDAYDVHDLWRKMIMLGWIECDLK